MKRLSEVGLLGLAAALALACGNGSRGAASKTYSVSGTLSGAVLEGVTVTLTWAPAGSKTTTTAADGKYSFTGIANGSYTATPTLDGYTFTPVSAATTVSDADATVGSFTAMPRIMNFLYALDFGYGGSGYNNLYITGYAIDQGTGSLSELDSSPVVLPSSAHSYFQFAAVPSGKFIYALDLGASSLAGYRVDPATGGLTQVQVSPLASYGALTPPRAMAIDRTGRFIYVVSAGYYVDNYLDVYEIAEDGSVMNKNFSTKINSSSGDGVFATVAPSGNFLHVLSFGQLDVYPIDPVTGAPASATQSATLAIGGTYANRMVMDSTGRHVHVGFYYYSYDPLTGTKTCQGYIRSYSVADAGTVTAMPGDPIPLGNYCIETMAIDPFDKQVYVGSQVNQTIYAYSVGDGGGLTGTGGGSDAWPSVFGLAFDRSGRFLYAATDPDVAGYSVNPNGGALQGEIQGSPFQPRSVNIAGGFSILTLAPQP